MNTPLMQVDIPELDPPHRGKVRDTFDLRDGTMLMVQTDRISAFDYKLQPGIPHKGKFLTAMTEFWFHKLSKLIPELNHHLISTDVQTFGHGLEQHANVLDKRSMLVKKGTVLPIEAIVRGYVAGSGWKDYQKTGKICGIELPKGLRQAEKIPGGSIFTPSTKSDEHDENISFEQMCGIIGNRSVASRVQALSIKTYEKAAEVALAKGIIIADTKFEWSYDKRTDELMLIDEVLTPDSSRFWPADQYQVGNDPPSYDKQILRNWLTNESGWNKESGEAPPRLSDSIVQNTLERYALAYRLLTGEEPAALIESEKA